MLDIARLEVDRQINVGNALGVILAMARPTPLLSGTRTRGDAVVAATLGLVTAGETMPVQVDRATDAVLTAFDRCTGEQERMLLDTVVPLGDAQRVTLGQVRLLRTRLFGQGTGYIRLQMDLEWRYLSDLRGRMLEPEVAAAIDGLGLRAHADHLLAHIERYGKVLGQDAGATGRAEATASAAWHEAFKRFAAQVLLDYEHDAAMQRELLQPYQAQLELQRAAARAEARARRSRSEAEAEEAAPASGAAGAPPA